MRRTVFGETLEWKQVGDAYYWDRLEQAYQMAQDLGIGPTGGYASFFRGIEGEYVTRQASVQEKVSDWLTLEYISAEVPHPEKLRDGVVAACDEIAERLEWRHGPEVMVSVLAIEADAPWAVGRYGYFVDKFPYDKICLPNHAAHDERYLHETTMHEYAHCIVLNLAEGHAPRWLNEAIAMVAQGGADPQVAKRFATGEIEWHRPAVLTVEFVAEEEGRSRAGLWHAYQQSACIGAYLADLKGERYLAELLKAFSDNSLLGELKMRVTNQSPADEALRQAYGFGEEELFVRSLSWLREGGSVSS